jgi:hypothetical protein
MIPPGIDRVFVGMTMVSLKNIGPVPLSYDAVSATDQLVP